jgi:hypothetical protein
MTLRYGTTDQPMASALQTNSRANAQPAGPSRGSAVGGRRHHTVAASAAIIRVQATA